VLLALGAVISTAPGAAGCGDADEDDSTTTSPAANRNAVEAVDFGFEPGTVTIAVGETVRWNNAGMQIHNVKGRGFFSEALASGESYEHRFTAPGRYPYLCTLHPTTMRAVIAVGPKEGT
jgi:plastocyanin